MAPGGIEPPHTDSKSVALSTELRGRVASMPRLGGAKASLATPSQRPRGLCPCGRSIRLARPRRVGVPLRVAEGTRTPDHRDHNPGLYQLSYRHHAAGQDSPAAALANGIDQPIGRQPEGAPRRRAVVEHREMRRLEVAARLDADQL